jgi:signal transduction histidine kinase
MLADLRQRDQQLTDATQASLRAERLASIGSIAAGVAHEINNPLGFIKANEQLNRAIVAEVAADAALGQDARAKLADVAATLGDNLTGVQRIERIVRSLRQLAKPSHAKQATSLVPVLESALLLGSNRTRNTIEVRTELEDSLPMVNANPDELGQVFLNLLVNAAEAVEPGKGRITVRARRATGGVEGVEVEVEDNGCGIPPDVQAKLFTPFYTTKQQGTGLGLTISQRIIADHGGSLRVRSAPGGGTTFTVTLPLAPAAPAAPPPPPEADPATASLDRPPVMTHA